MSPHSQARHHRGRRATGRRRSSAGPPVGTETGSPAEADRTPGGRSGYHWLRGNPEIVWLAAALIALAVGAGLRLSGNRSAADAAWAAATVIGLVPSAAIVLRDLLRRRTGVDIVAVLALAGALALGEYLAGAVIAVMLSGGRALERMAGNRASAELSALVSRAPRVVHRYEDGAVTSPSLSEVTPGDLLLVKPGEVVPVDGRVAGGPAVLDESALTGESTLVERSEGDDVSSGVVNGGGPFDLRATSTAAESTYAGIVRMVDESRMSKAPLVRLADRFALVFLPTVLGAAGLAWAVSGSSTRALAVLVVATPCPLILAAPVAVVSGISRAARRGVIVKGGAPLEVLGKARVLLFDKTGTLTSGHPQVRELEVGPRWEPTEVLRLAASLDQVSPHVLASAVVRAGRDRGVSLALPSSVSEAAGQGVAGDVEGRAVRVGKAEWVADGTAVPGWARRIRRRTSFEGLANVFVSIDGEMAGALVLDDPIRTDSPRTLRALRGTGIDRIVMVTGDHADVAETVGMAVGVDSVLAERTPGEKLEAVRSEKDHGPVIMVGDGINDAPALALADVGVAMGARGSTASSEAADVVILVDRLERLNEGVLIARRSRRIALQSSIVGMSLSLGAMVFAAVGLLVPVGGALVQEAIDVAVILNALRALRSRLPSVPSAEGVELGRRMKGEHAGLIGAVHDIRATADQLDRLDPLARLASGRRVYDFLVERLLPHEKGEETSLYPLVARMIGGQDPIGPMMRAHVEIIHLTRLLGRLLDDCGDTGVGDQELPELRRLLYGLHAVLRLHFAQEDEAYLSLLSAGDEAPEARTAGP